MTKEEFQKRLDEVNQQIEQNANAYKEALSQKEALMVEGMAKHNMMIGQRNEIMEWLKKFDEVAG